MSEKVYRFIFFKRCLVALFIILFFLIGAGEVGAAGDLWDSSHNTDPIYRNAIESPEPNDCECRFNFTYKYSSQEAVFGATHENRYFTKDMTKYYNQDTLFFFHIPVYAPGTNLNPDPFQGGVPQPLYHVTYRLEAKNCRIIYEKQYTNWVGSVPEAGRIEPATRSEVLAAQEIAASSQWNFHYLTPPTCRFYGEPLCCCKAIEAGTLGRNNQCEAAAVRGSTADADACLQFGIGEYKPFPLPPDGNCKSLEEEQTIYTPEKQTFDISMEKLKQDAAAKLNPLNFTDPTNFLGRMIAGMMANIGAIALALYIWAGITWMTAQGNQEKLTKAKQILLWTSLGLVVILSSYILVSFIFKDVLAL